MKSRFVDVSDIIQEVILDVRYYSTYNFVGKRVDGYEAPIVYLTKEAALALKGVSEEMVSKGYQLKIYDGYRPQRAVEHFKSWAKEDSDTGMKEDFYPEKEKSDLFTEGYIATKSGHSRGSTIDLTLVDMVTQKEIDMGGTFDYFGERSYPSYVGDLTQEQINNRNMLQEVMMRHDFLPFDTEWWHFTLKNEPFPDTYFDFVIK